MQVVVEFMKQHCGEAWEDENLLGRAQSLKSKVRPALSSGVVLLLVLQRDGGSCGGSCCL